MLLAPQGDSLALEHEHRQLSTQKRPLTTFGFFTAVFDKYCYRFRKPHGGCCLFRVGVGEGILLLHAQAQGWGWGGGLPLLSRTSCG